MRVGKSAVLRAITARLTAVRSTLPNRYEGDEHKPQIESGTFNGLWLFFSQHMDERHTSIYFSIGVNGRDNVMTGHLYPPDRRGQPHRIHVMSWKRGTWEIQFLATRH